MPIMHMWHDYGILMSSN